MNKSSFIVLFIVLSSIISFGQEIGISYGTTNIIDYYSLSSNPHNIIAHTYIPMSFDTNLIVGVSLGYGFGSYSTKWDYDKEEYNESIISTSGFPFECEILYFKSINNDNSFRIFLGIGGGYYSYKSKTEYKGAWSGLRTDEESIYGIAQYFTFGVKLKIIKSISTFLQLKKNGTSAIKKESDLLANGEKYGTLIRDIPTSDNFKDFGFSMGLSISL